MNYVLCYVISYTDYNTCIVYYYVSTVTYVVLGLFSVESVDDEIVMFSFSDNFSWNLSYLKLHEKRRTLPFLLTPYMHAKVNDLSAVLSMHANYWNVVKTDLHMHMVIVVNNIIQVYIII